MADTTSSAAPSPSLRQTALWIALVAALILGGTFVTVGSRAIFTNSLLFQMALNHFAATVGLPCAALASLCVVTVLENVQGPIEFEGLGFKFKGASGPIILWIFSFLAIASAIKLLWPLGK